MKTFSIIAFSTILFVLVSPGYAQEAASSSGGGLPWLAHIEAGDLTRISSIAADASVTVSDGLTYETKTVYHDPQRALFHREYVDRSAAHGVEGRYIWAYDGKVETEAPATMDVVVLGHQHHAMILFFDRIHTTDYSATPAEFNGQQCTQVVGTSEGQTWTFYYKDDGQPIGMVAELPDGLLVSHVFGDWRDVSGMSLPFNVKIDDGSRQFEYVFSSIRINEDTLGLLRAPASVLTDEQLLLRLHRTAMDDHLFGQVDGIIEQRGDKIVIVSGGEIYEMDGDAFDGSILGMMSNRDYITYDDLVRPIIKVSEDGTLGWIIVQVSAAGVRFDDAGAVTGPLEFVSAWVALCEKVDGEWKMVGNVSNLQPGAK